MDIFIDFKSPAAYLCLTPTLALADRLGEAITWQPLQTRQSAVPLEQKDEDRGTTHRRVRALARQNMHLHYADVLGVPMQFRAEPGSTDLALVALETLEGDRTAFVQAAFTAYWTTDADLSAPDTINRILAETNCSADLSQAEAAMDAMFDRAQAVGAIDAPAYSVRGELFIGREHLPWIETLIATAAQETT